MVKAGRVIAVKKRNNWGQEGYWEEVVFSENGLYYLLNLFNTSVDILEIDKDEVSYWLKDRGFLGVYK